MSKIILTSGYTPSEETLMRVLRSLGFKKIAEISNVDLYCESFTKVGRVTIAHEERTIRANLFLDSYGEDPVAIVTFMIA